ncbi:MAG: winged helix-turn-helix domain-containing protein [Acidobacteria bacterium]|nr:winged helix-turn-helix domain-containing protein [Acidobacteriota bacterium]
MQPTFEFNDFRLETAERRLLRNGDAIALAPKVFDTLVALVENPGRLMSKDELMHRLWPDTFVEEVSLAQNISQLRKALGEPVGDAQIIQTVAKRGYRFVAPVRIVPNGQGFALSAAVPVEQQSPPSEIAEPTGRTGQPNWKIVAGLAGAALVLAGVVLFVPFFQRAGKASAAREIRSIAVLPLTNLSQDAEQEFFADGVTDDLITELARIRALRVISRTSVMQYKGTRKTLPEIARELKVDAIVEGTVSQRNGNVHITAQLVQANPEQHVWAESYERPLAEAQNLQSEIARAIGAAVRATMTPEEQARMRRSRAINSDANLLYLKGRFFWNKRTAAGAKDGEKYFQQAIARDADFAQAYVGLAGAYIFEGGWGVEPATIALPKAEQAARQALVLDPENAEAHAALGLIAMNYEWNWPKAEREYKQAIALNPNDAIAHHWYGEYLAAQGRFDEGLEELRRAEELDPLSVAIVADRAKILYFARRYNEVIAQSRKALEMDPGFLSSYSWMMRSYARQGMQEEAQAALEALRQAGATPLDYQSNFSILSARIGHRDEARQILDRNRDLFDTSPGTILFVVSAAGDKEEAFTWMEKCLGSHSTSLTSLKVNPDYDDLRGDPRFIKYLGRVGLSN